MVIKLKTVQFILFVIIIVGLVSGFSMGMADNNFLLNLLAEITGLSLGILVASLVVDKSVKALNDASREEQWSRVRNSTYRSIIDDLCIVAFNIYIKLPIAGLSYTESYDPSYIRTHNEHIIAELPNKFEIFSNLIPQIIRSPDHEIATEEGLSVGEKEVYRILKTTFEDIQPVLDGIRYLKIPRLIQSSTDQEIINTLNQFEGIIDGYYYNMRRFNRENADISRATLITRSMKILIDKALELYSQIKARTDNTKDTQQIP